MVVPSYRKYAYGNPSKEEATRDMKEINNCKLNGYCFGLSCYKRHTRLPETRDGVYVYRLHVYNDGGFFLAYEDFGRMFGNLFPACAFFVLFSFLF